MKKTLLLTALTAAVLGFAGCGDSNTNPTPAANDTAENSPAAESLSPETAAPTDLPAETAAPTDTPAETAAEPAEMPETEPEYTEPAANDGWKTAYQDALNAFMNSEYYSEESRWDLQDLDNDGTPELLISPAQYHAAGVAYYYCADGQAIALRDESGETLYFGSYGAVNVCPEEHLVGVTDLHMGYAYASACRYENHTLTRIQTLSDNATSVGIETITYTINDAEVSQEDYEAALSDYNAKNWSAAGTKYNFSDFSALEN